LHFDLIFEPMFPSRPSKTFQDKADLELESRVKSGVQAGMRVSLTSP